MRVNGGLVEGSARRPGICEEGPCVEYGNYTVKAGEVWAISVRNRERGFDSRYFGPVKPLHSVVALLTE